LKRRTNNGQEGAVEDKAALLATGPGGKKPGPVASQEGIHNGRKRQQTTVMTKVGKGGGGETLAATRLAQNLAVILLANTLRLLVNKITPPPDCKRP